MTFTLLLRWLCFLVLVGLTGLLVWSSLGYYLRPQEMPLFQMHPSMAQYSWWRINLILHVSSGILCLLASLAQFSRGVLRRYPQWHRRSGNLYALVTLAVMVPTGLLLAPTAQGGWAGVFGFVLLGLGTAWTTALGLCYAKQKCWALHAPWMLRSFALVSTALSFRAAYLLLVMARMPLESAYVVAFYLTFFAHIFAVELFIRRFIQKTKTTNNPTHEKNIIAPQVSVSRA